MGRIDDERIKQSQREAWDHAAPYWRRYDEHVRRNSVQATRRMLELAEVQPGQRVLDIASGTGEPGLPAAELVGPSGFVLLSDQSAEMLAIARDKARAQDLRNVEFRVSDAEQLVLDPESFDAALCRGGLCLMPQPVRCLRTVYEALKPGGRISVLVLGRPEANPYFVIPFAVLSKYASFPPYDPTLPGPFALADPEKLRSVLAEAGFEQIELQRMTHIWELDSGRDYWDYMRFSPVASALEQIPGDQHARIADEIATAAGGGDPNRAVELPGEFVIASAVR